MFSTLKGFVMGVFVTSIAFIGGAFTHHVVRSQEGIKLVPRVEYAFLNIYVDVRNWGPADYWQHPEIAKALAQSGLKDAKSVVSQDYDQAVARFKDKMKSAGQQMEQGLKSLLRSAGGSQ
jgi:hypothetical protein